MTKQEFFVRLALVPNKFHLLKDGSVRTVGKDPLCPIVALSKQLHGVESSISGAALALGIRSVVAVKIIRAADNRESCDKDIRRQLLKAAM